MLKAWNKVCNFGENAVLTKKWISSKILNVLVKFRRLYFSALSMLDLFIFLILKTEYKILVHVYLSGKGLHSPFRYADKKRKLALEMGKIKNYIQNLYLCILQKRDSCGLLWGEEGGAVAQWPRYRSPGSQPDSSPAHGKSSQLLGGFPSGIPQYYGLASVRD